MALTDVPGLIVSDEELAECLTVVASADEVEAGGFAVEDALSPDQPLLSRRFVVSDDPNAIIVGGRGEFRFDVNYYTEFDLPAGSLDGCVSTALVLFALEIDHDAATVTVRVRIHLSGAARFREMKRVFRRTIEDVWSGKYALSATSGNPPRPQYTILVDVDFVDPDGEPHYAVRLRQGCGRDNMTNWHMESADITAAHEFGHMLGAIDEYDGTADGCPDRPVHDHSIMNKHVRWTHPAARHYFLVRRAAELALCATFEVVSLRLEGPALFGDEEINVPAYASFIGEVVTCGGPGAAELPERTVLQGLRRILFPIWP